MLSNFDIEEIAHFYKIDIVVVMKDEFIKIKPISGNYIINLESSKDGNGTHWMALRIEDFNCVMVIYPQKKLLLFVKEFINLNLHIIQKKYKIYLQLRVDFILLHSYFFCILINKLYLTYSLDYLHFLKYFTIIQKTIIKIYNYFIENYPILQIYKSLKKTI